MSGMFLRPPPRPSSFRPPQDLVAVKVVVLEVEVVGLTRWGVPW